MLADVSTCCKQVQSLAEHEEGTRPVEGGHSHSLCLHLNFVRSHCEMRNSCCCVWNVLLRDVLSHSDVISSLLMSDSKLRTAAQMPGAGVKPYLMLYACLQMSMAIPGNNSSWISTASRIVKLRIACSRYGPTELSCHSAFETVARDVY